jgi:predicted enzyme involved in methoxymalonyl-ACP biosynthesis
MIRGAAPGTCGIGLKQDVGGLLTVSQATGEVLVESPPSDAERSRSDSPGTGAPDPVALFRSQISPDMDFTAAGAAARRLKKMRRDGAGSPVKARIAILGSTTTTQVASFIDLFLFAQNIDAEIYEAPYGLLRQEILDPSSDLYAFRPDFVFLATTRRDLGALPAVSDTPEQVQLAVDAAVGEWQALWQTAHDRLGCQIIQNNFDAPPWRVFGNLEATQPGAPGNFVGRVNRDLAALAPGWVSVHDLDGLAASIGRWNWGDERFFHLAKLPCAPEHLTIYAHRIAALIGARLGRSRKCLVLDLDNTLWGGVIGDDGLAGINIGQVDAVG